MDRSEQIRKELEEKRRKLAEFRKNKQLRKRNETTKPVEPPPPVSEPVPQEEVAPKQPVKEEPSSEPVKKEDKVEAILAALNVHGDDKRRKTELSFSNVKVLEDIAPLQVESYEKEIQTEMTMMLQKSNGDENEVEDVEKTVDDENESSDLEGDEQQEDVIEIPPDEVRLMSEEERYDTYDTEAFHDFFEWSVPLIDRLLKTRDNHLYFDYVEDADTSSVKQQESMLRFRDSFVEETWASQRAVTSLSWSPSHEEVFLASYFGLDKFEGESDAGSVILWSFLNDVPVRVLSYPLPVTCAIFHPTDPSLIIGGTDTGQLLVWDIRERQRRNAALATPPSSQGHTHPIVGLRYGESLISVSSDGKLCNWDLSKLTNPIFARKLEYRPATSANEKQEQKSFLPSALAFPPKEEKNIMVGSEDGTLWMIRHNGDIAPGMPDTPLSAHSFPVTSLDFHPGALQSASRSDDFMSPTVQLPSPFSAEQYILSSSMDWSCKLWSRSPGSSLELLHSFDALSDIVYDARWCPVHPGVFAAADGRGQVSIWNICSDIEKPIHMSKVSDRSLGRVLWGPRGDMLVVGDCGGNLSVYDVDGSQLHYENYENNSKLMQERIDHMRSSSYDK